MNKATSRVALGGLLASVALFVPEDALKTMFMEVSIADQIARLEAKRAELEAKATGITKAPADGEDLSDEQSDEIDTIANEIEGVDKRIASLTKLLPKGQGRKTTGEQNRAGAEGGNQRITNNFKDPTKHHFANLGEFAMAARSAALKMESDGTKKLMNAVTTYGNEGAGADGGYLVPPEFSQAIWQKVEAEENLMSRCTEYTPSGNSMSVPKDETTPWGTAGIRAYWEAEAAAATASKASFELSMLRLHKLFALVPASEELLEDAKGYESYLMAKVPGIMSHKINTAIISGSGAGQPLGVLNSPSLISVAKETSQPADSLWLANINKMWSRMYSPWRRNAVWLINQDAEPALEQMGYSPSGVVPTAASAPVYMPPGGVSEAPYGRLKGRPVIPLQACKTVGDQGDLILVDFKQYILLRKAAGMKTDTSIHLYFDQAVTAFRFIFRINGQPAWSAAISPENGSNTLSWAVTLDAR